MLPVIPRKKSAADVHIKGSAGEFSVSHGGRSTLRVNYLLSHVGLDRDGDQQEKVLSCLQPFREIFDVGSLDFEQIMQRDIDDARVSNELIPYLMERSSRGLVKLFPPIIVVVLPTDASGRMSPHYPSVNVGREVEDGLEYEVTRSGPVGQEVFELRHWINEGERMQHDLASLRINPERCKLVIVDGQHRAMSLIALYRNIKKWPDRARNVEPYYKMWTPKRIEEFDLRGARLPIMFCVFPQIDGDPARNDLPVHAACRSIFLALNKNAKAVSRSRNLLLDDRDVIAVFLRQTLGYIKDRDTNSAERVRIWSVELDNEKDRLKLNAPTAITGVTHLHALIERLLLSEIPSQGLTARQQNLWKKTSLEESVRRLGLQGDLVITSSQPDRKNACDPVIAGRLGAAFAQVYLPVIVRGFDAFGPYSVHHDAAGALLQTLAVEPLASFYRSILFDGEGAQRTFQEFLKQLDERVKEELDPPPEIRQTRDEFHAREKKLKELTESMRAERSSTLLSRAAKDVRDTPALHAWIDQTLYRDIVTTAAFQNALFLTFFSVIEEVNAARTFQGRPSLDAASVRALFDEYLEGLNAFFVPKGFEGLRRLISVFHGEFNREGELSETSYSLRRILFPGESKPDEWPKFRAILQELWHLENTEVLAVLQPAREFTRAQMLQRYVARRIKERCKELGVDVAKLSPQERSAVDERCLGEVVRGLAALGVKINPSQLLERSKTQAIDETEE
jgi:DNA-sulfur modification-associated